MTHTRHPGFMTGIALLVPITLSTMAIVLLAPILPRLLAEFHDVPQFEYRVPMILTIPALCIATMSTFAGMLGDYFGRRRLLIGALLVYAVVGVAPVFLTDLNAILASRIGVGMAEAMIMVLTTTMIGDYFTGAARDRWLAAQTAFASMSALVFFNVGGQLGAIGWRAPFWVYGSALVMLALVLLFTWEPGGDAHDGDSDEAEVAPHNVGWTGFPWVRMLSILAITAYGAVFFYTVQIHAASGLTGLGLTDPARIGFLTSIASVGVPLGTLFYSRVGAVWTVVRLLSVEFALLAVGFLAMGTASNPTWFLIGCFINQLGGGMLLPTLLVWAMSLLDFRFRGRGAGMWQSAFALGQFLSPVVVTFAGKSLGGFPGAMLMLSAAAAVGVLAVLVLRPQAGDAGQGTGIAAHG